MKVLSIDIDYAFPDVDEWPNEDDEMWDEWHPHTKWDFYFKKYPDLDCRERIIEEKCLDYMLDTFTKALTVSPNAHVWFGMDHDYILEYLHDKDNIDLVNIDHHDDFLAGCFLQELEEEDHSVGEYMNGEQDYLAAHLLEYALTKSHNKVDEGSWGAWLHSNNKLNSMIWIRNEGKIKTDTRHISNTFICENMGVKPVKWDSLLAEEYDHGNYEYDAIFVCLSPNYFPKSQWHLFSIFMGIYEDFTGKSCKLDDFWHKKWLTRMAYQKPYEILSESLAQVKKSLDK
jgi:hypothetical protein